MSQTNEITVTRDWQKLHDDNCIVQSIYSSDLFQFAGGPAEPTNDKGILFPINEPKEVNLKGAVWCRLPLGSRNESEKIIVIK